MTGNTEQIYKNRSRAIISENVSERDSFASCLAELRQRFAGRGMVQSVRRDAKRQSVAVATARAMAPGVYADYGVRTTVADRFRTGVYQGERYMTNRDFARYYAEHRKKMRPDADYRSMAVARGVRNAEIPMPRAKEPLLGAASEESRRFVGRAFSKLPAAVREKHPALEERAAQVHTWVTSDRVENAPVHMKRKFPVSIASAILVGVISLSLVVGGTVMYSDANSTYRAASAELAELKEEEGNLTRALSVKVDLAEVEDYARNELGMVDRVYAGGAVVDVAKEEEILVYEDESPAFGLSTLLSAFGFGD